MKTGKTKHPDTFLLVVFVLLFLVIATPALFVSEHSITGFSVISLISADESRTDIVDEKTVEHYTTGAFSSRVKHMIVDPVSKFDDLLPLLFILLLPSLVIYTFYRSFLSKHPEPHTQHQKLREHVIKTEIGDDTSSVLKDYVETASFEGHSKSKIKRSLVKEGWDEQIVTDYLDHYFSR